jgi:chloride channel 7
MECLDFALKESNIFKTRPEGTKVELYSWLLFLITGIGIGIVAFFINLIEEELVDLRWSSAQHLIYSHSLVGAWLAYMSLGILFGGVAAAMTIWIGPGAAGSGVAELMGYVNGVNYPKFLGRRTLVVKALGVALAVSAGFKIGKEGPLAHIGANIGVLCIYLPLGFTQLFRNDTDKREIIAAGAGAGVSAAFGSPIGGTLFAYEVSSPTSFWTFKLMWKSFMCSSVATFILNILVSLQHGGDIDLSNAGLIKFGQFVGKAFDVE